MEGSPRRNSSSDMMNAAQVSIPTIRMTLQEAPMRGTCLMNIREGRKLKNIYGKVATIALNALQLLFFTAFMWRRLLKSTALATTTHRKPKRVFDGTDT